MEHSTSVPNERVLRITQLAKLSFNPPSVVLTAEFFQYFYKSEFSFSPVHRWKKKEADLVVNITALVLSVHTSEEQHNIPTCAV